MTENRMILADGEKSHNCLEGDRFPSADMYLSLQAIYRFGLEGTDVTELIQHHIKYKEIHGEDKIVLMTRSEHNIPFAQLKEIAKKAQVRTEKFKMVPMDYDLLRTISSFICYSMPYPIFVGITANNTIKALNIANSPNNILPMLNELKPTLDALMLSLYAC